MPKNKNAGLKGRRRRWTQVLG